MAAGSPAELESSDNYARSTAVVRAILRVAGAPGTFDHQDTRQQSLGDDDSEWAEFLQAVRAVFDDRTWSARELLARVVTESVDRASTREGLPAPRDMIPLDALPTELVDKVNRARDNDVRVIVKSLGMWLRNRDGRWAGDLTCRQAGKDRNGVALWRIERTGPSR